MTQNQESVADLLGKHPFFEDFAEKYRESLVECGRPVSFKKGEEVFLTGEQANDFFLINKGRVVIQVPASGGNPISIQTVSPGSVLGWSWLIPPHIWRFDATALDDVEGVAMDGRCLRGKVETDHELGYELLQRFARVMADRLENTRIQLLDIYGRGNE